LKFHPAKLKFFVGCHQFQKVIQRKSKIETKLKTEFKLKEPQGGGAGILLIELPQKSFLA